MSFSHINGGVFTYLNVTHIRSIPFVYAIVILVCSVQIYINADLWAKRQGKQVLKNVPKNV